MADILSTRSHLAIASPSFQGVTVSSSYAEATTTAAPSDIPSKVLVLLQGRNRGSAHHRRRD